MTKEEDPQIYQGLLWFWNPLRVNGWHKCIISNSVNLKHKKTEEKYAQIRHNQTSENEDEKNNLKAARRKDMLQREKQSQK